MSGKQTDRELWGIRFRKMLNVEKLGVEECQKLLDECKANHSFPVIEPHLEQLVRDEIKHSLLVEKLIQLLDKQEKSDLISIKKGRSLKVKNSRIDSNRTNLVRSRKSIA